MGRHFAVLFTVALAVLGADASARRAQPADTVIVADDDLLRLHIAGDRYRPLAYHEMPYMAPSGNIMADAVAAGIAGAIVNSQLAIRQQKQRDAPLAPLTGRLGRRGLQPLLGPHLREPFTEGGTRRAVVAFGRAADLEPDLFHRIEAARGATRFVFVRKAAMARGPVGLPIALSGGMLRLALDVEVREGSVERNERVLRQEVVFELPVADDLDGAVARYTGEDPSLLAADLAEALPAALAIVLDRTGYPQHTEGAQVGVIVDGDMRVHHGVLLAHADGRALIATPGKVLLSVPADAIGDPAARRAAGTERLRMDPQEAEPLR